MLYDNRPLDTQPNPNIPDRKLPGMLRLIDASTSTVGLVMPNGRSASMQPGGWFDSRDPGTFQAYEKATLVNGGAYLVFHPTDDEFWIVPIYISAAELALLDLPQ